MLVRPDHDVTDVEWVLERVRGDDDGGVRPDSISHPQLIRRIDVVGREIRDDEIGLIEPLIHGLVDGA